MPRSNIAPVKKTSLRETVARAVRAAIISGEMVSGEIYSAPSLGARFGVSPTPVREAMLDLIKEGLITTAPNKGFRVAEVSDKDLDEITQIRLLIEPRVVARAVTSIPVEDIPKLRIMAEAIVRWADAGNLTEYTEADREFHLALLGYSGNTRLVELVSELRVHTRLFGLIPLMEQGRLAATAQEHVELVDMIASGDIAGVEYLMYRHIGQVRGIWATAEGTSAPEHSDDAHM